MGMKPPGCSLLATVAGATLDAGATKA